MGQGLPVRPVDHSVRSTPSNRKSPPDQSPTIECRFCCRSRPRERLELPQRFFEGRCDLFLPLAPVGAAAVTHWY